MKKPLDDQALFRQRCRRIYDSQRKRKPVPGLGTDRWDFEIFYRYVQISMPDYCTYCRLPITLFNWQLDHRTPLSRGGDDSQENLGFPCEDCNQQKGALTETEYKALLTVVATFDYRAATDFWRRLRNGGKWKSLNAATARQRKTAGTFAGLKLAPGVRIEE